MKQKTAFLRKHFCFERNGHFDYFLKNCSENLIICYQKFQTWEFSLIS